MLTMALTLARSVNKVGGLLRATPTSLQITAKYARHVKRRVLVPEKVKELNYKEGGLYEPDYLYKLRPRTKQHKILDIDIMGYDFPVLEKFQSYMYKHIRDMGLTYLDSYGHPNTVTDVEVLKPNSETVQEVYHLRSFKRTIQISDFPVYKIGLLIDILYAAAPPGVSFTIVPHHKAREEDRYVPDVYIAETKRELDILKSSK